MRSATTRINWRRLLAAFLLLLPVSGVGIAIRQRDALPCENYGAGGWQPDLVDDPGNLVAPRWRITIEEQHRSSFLNCLSANGFTIRLITSTGVTVAENGSRQISNSYSGGHVHSVKFWSH